MSSPRNILVLSSAADSWEPAFEALAKRGAKARCVGEIYRFVAAFAAERPELAVVDLEGLRRQDIEMLRALREVRPDAGIVALVDRDQLQMAAAALCGGADLYLLKPVSTPEILEAVDRADRRRQLAEMESRRDNRGEMLATFAVGVTQKIHDALTVMSIPLQFLIQDHAEDEALVKELNSLKREVDRIANVSRQLLTFARQSSPGTEPVDMGRLIADLGRVYAEQCRQRGVEVVVNVAPNTPPTTGDEAQLRQACEAILEQTVTAMNGQGRIEISCAPKANGVEVVFQDNGPAIPRDILSSIFDPLQAGRRGGGKEMGLAMASGIVRSHGGKLEAQSDDTPLTRFILWLPHRQGPRRDNG